MKSLDLHEPLILVGWSAGGVYIREFARQHPELAAGIVFIYSLHENQEKSYPDELALIEQQDQDSFKEILTRLSKMTHDEILNDVSDSPWQNKHPSTHKYFADQARPEAIKYWLELLSYFEEDANQGDDALKSLGNIPLIVISKAKDDNPKLNDEERKLISEIWNELQSELAHLSTSHRQIKVDSGHDIANEKPEIVIEAIADVVGQVRRKG